MALHVNQTARDELVAAVYRCLQDEGQATRAEIARSMGRDTEQIGSVLTRMNKPGVKLRKRIYVIDWVYDDEGDARRYPRAVYAIGDKDDKPKPRAETAAEHTQRYRDKRKGRASSIFAKAQYVFAPSVVRG